ncbi:hypothetical protein LZ30DRAFT_685156 [Colletotrichum cereale]|nr:hypothetical protein LZ30DRAFT_685156 [Colletotrichum cereale]
MKDLAFLTGLLLASAGPLLVGAETQPAPAASLTSATATAAAVSRARLRPTAIGCTDCFRPRRKYFVPPELPTSASSSSSAATAAAATGSGSSETPAESTDETSHGIGGPPPPPTDRPKKCYKARQNRSCGPKKPKVPKHPRLPAEPEATTPVSSAADPVTVTITVGPSNTPSPAPTSYTVMTPPQSCWMKARQRGICGGTTYPLTVALPMTTSPVSPDSPGADPVTVTVTATPSDTSSSVRRRVPTAREHTPTYILDPRPTGAALEAREVEGQDGEDLEELVSGGLRKHPEATQKPKLA